MHALLRIAPTAPAVLLCAVFVLGAAGCGPSRQPQGAGAAAHENPGAESEWRWLTDTQRTLAERRDRLAATTAAAATDPKQAAARDALRRETAALTEELDRRLVDFINADPPVQGQPLTERQKAALRMKSDEDIALARRFIDEGGDYQRALEIYREALAVDPGYHRLEEEMAKAQARRYMARETFAQVEKGMDQEQVRALLGQPNLHSVREYPERGVVGWFYPKDATGAAAAVWFARADGRYAVYLADFEALKPRGAGEPAPGPAVPPRPPAARPGPST